MQEEENNLDDLSGISSSFTDNKQIDELVLPDQLSALNRLQKRGKLSSTLIRYLVLSVRNYVLQLSVIFLDCLGRFRDRWEPALGLAVQAESSLQKIVN